MLDVFYIVITLFLVLLNAFFVAAEFGMVKIRNTQIEVIKEDSPFRGEILEQIHKQLDVYLSACQLGITLASLGLGWLGEPALAHLLKPVFEWFNLASPELIRIISFSTAFAILSFLHIVIGELMPKTLAVRQPTLISIWTAVPLYFFYWLMFPAIWLLNLCSNAFLRATKLSLPNQAEHFTTEEIKLILSASHVHGELTLDERNIITQTLDLADLVVTEVMRPKEEMVMLDISEPIDVLLEKVSLYRYSRYPIFDKDIHEIIGIIHVKDLFSNLYKDKEIKDLRPLIRPVLKVNLNFPALHLLRKFRSGMPHFALVLNSEKKVIGFVTLDNLLHILIGRIQDEFHKTRDDWIQNPDGSFSVKGDCSIYSLEKALNQDIELDNDDIITIQGLIFNNLGYIPDEGQRIKLENFEIIIEKKMGNRIQWLKLYPIE